MSQYFPSCNTSTKNIKLKLDLSNYVTKGDKTDILKLENRIKENEKEASFSRGFFYYRDQRDFIYECRANSFNYTNNSTLLSAWKSTGIINRDHGIMDSVSSPPQLKKSNEIFYVYFHRDYFKRTEVVIPKDTINIYCVYELDLASYLRDHTFIIQDALFGAIEITKNTDILKYKYKGYGICFDANKRFTNTLKEGNFDHTTLGKNVIIFGADMSF